MSSNKPPPRGFVTTGGGGFGDNGELDLAGAGTGGDGRFGGG